MVPIVIKWWIGKGLISDNDRDICVDYVFQSLLGTCVGVDSIKIRASLVVIFLLQYFFNKMSLELMLSAKP